MRGVKNTYRVSRVKYTALGIKHGYILIRQLRKTHRVPKLVRNLFTEAYSKALLVERGVPTGSSEAEKYSINHRV